MAGGGEIKRELRKRRKDTEGEKDQKEDFKMAQKELVLKTHRRIFKRSLKKLPKNMIRCDTQAATCNFIWGGKIFILENYFLNQN